MNMKKLITLLFTGLSALLTACSSYSDTSVLPVEIYNHTSKAINFNMTDATKKDWKGGELGYEWGANGIPITPFFSNGLVITRSILTRSGHLSNFQNMRIRIYFIWRYTFFLMTPLKLL